MLPVLLLSLLSLYRPENWQVFPCLDEVRCISTTGSEVYVAVPAGVCVLDRPRFRLLRTLNQADGIQGEVRLCAHSPARGDVFITADAPPDGGYQSQRVYRYLPSTGRVEELSAPFKSVSSIGTAEDGAYFDTDAGLFFRARNAAEFAAVSELPGDVTWYGRNDTLEPRDFPFLTPYFVMDEQLVNRAITRVRPDKGGRRLFAAVRDYGIVVYNIRSGFSESHIRFGPSLAPVRRITRLDNRLWLVGGQTAVSLDSAQNWNYFLTRPGDLSTGGFRLLLGNVTNLERSEGLSALVDDPSGLLLGTDNGAYQLGPDGRLVQLVSQPRRVNGLLRVRDSLLIGTDFGLFYAQGESVVEYPDPYGATDWGVFDITRAENGTAYFGTLGGIVSRTSDGRWFRYVPPGLDLKQPVSALAAAGTLVFMATPSPTPGLPSSVITVLDTKDGLYTTIDATRGLPVSEITSLYADDRFLWIASPRLIARLDYTKELR
jgi:hypothetical protein